MKPSLTRLRLFFGARLADQHRDAAVAQIERRRASHVAIADAGDHAPGESAEIAIFFVIN